MDDDEENQSEKEDYDEAEDVYDDSSRNYWFKKKILIVN